jgi:hypothetical protein
MNIVIKRQKHKCNYSHVDLSFLFLRVYLGFGSENYRDHKHISYEHTHFFLKKNQNLKIQIFICGIM